MTNLQRLTINRVIQLIKEAQRLSMIKYNERNDIDKILEECTEWLKNIDDTIYIEG